MPAENICNVYFWNIVLIKQKISYAISLALTIFLFLELIFTLNLYLLYSAKNLLIKLIIRLNLFNYFLCIKKEKLYNFFSPLQLIKKYYYRWIYFLSTFHHSYFFLFAILYSHISENRWLSSIKLFINITYIVSSWSLCVIEFEIIWFNMVLSVF